jgi:hypothetical protein
VLRSSLVKFWFRNKTPRARAKAFVSYGGKQNSVKIISSTVYGRKESAEYVKNRGYSQRLIPSAHSTTIPYLYAWMKSLSSKNFQTPCISSRRQFVMRSFFACPIYYRKRRQSLGMNQEEKGYMQCAGKHPSLGIHECILKCFQKEDRLARVLRYQSSQGVCCQTRT